MYTCGSEGIVYFWNTKDKNKLADYSHGVTSVTAGDMQSSGKYFAYALGYDWSQGYWGLSDFSGRSMICVHEILRTDVGV
jgi:mRNA export factor